MQFTTATLATTFLGLAAASALLPEETIFRRSTPQICLPIDKFNQDNNYTYEDETWSCAEDGNCEAACGTFITTGAQPGFTSQLVSDLLQAMGDQVTKDGQLQVTTVGPFIASFPLGTTAVHNRNNIVGEWSLATNTYVATGGGIPPTTFYQASGNGYYDVIVVDYIG